MELAEYENMFNVDHRHWWWRGRTAIFEAVLKHHFSKPGASILEVGCGTGANLGMLQKFGRVTAMECEAYSCELLRKKNEGVRSGAIRLLEQGIEQPLAENFDLVCLFDVLEHIEDDGGAVQWIADHLRPGGLAFLSVPAFPILWSVHDEAAHHQRRYRKRDLERLLGPRFRMVHSSYFNSVVFPPVLAIRLWRRFRPKGELKTDMAYPGDLPNAVLHAVFRSETAVVPRISLPFGVSLLAVAQRVESA